MSQKEYVDIFIDCFIFFLKEQKELFPEEEAERLIARLSQVRSSNVIMFKDFDFEVADFLRNQLNTVSLKLGLDRFGAAAKLEEIFQRIRASDSYFSALQKIVPDDLVEDKSEKKILIAGCGEAPELRFLLKKWDSVHFFLCDIDKRIMQIAEHLSSKNSPEDKVRCTFKEVDLRLSSEAENINYDSFIFFHPLLLDFNKYVSLMRNLNQQKESGKRKELMSLAALSTDATMIFDNLIYFLPSHGQGLITVVDELEAQALYQYLQSKPVDFSVYSNPYAIRKLSVMLSAGTTARELEQRTYHFIFRLRRK